MEDIFKQTITSSCDLLTFLLSVNYLAADLERLILEVAILCGQLWFIVYSNTSSACLLLLFCCIPPPPKTLIISLPFYYWTYSPHPVLLRTNANHLKTKLSVEGNVLQFKNCTSEATVVKRLVHQTVFTCPMTINCLC